MLNQKDIEVIEKLIYKCGDDISIAIGRSFEHLEERINDLESRIYSRLADVDEKFEDSRQSIVDSLDAVRDDLRELDRAE